MNVQTPPVAMDGPVRSFLDLADELVARSADERGVDWLRASIRELEATGDARALEFAIGLAPRRLGKADLRLTEADRARVAALRPGLDLTGWSVDQLARVALIVSSYRGDDEAFAHRLEAFCSTAEINENIALSRGFAIYPAARLIERRAREAVRSAIKPVFEAIAHRNPYPAENFDVEAWNQMIVKALFIGSELWPIHDLDRRANPHLATMLLAYARERRAAGRPVSHELWRCVAPFADKEALDAMAEVLRVGTERERLAIALASRTDPSLEQRWPGHAIRALQERVEAENLDWESLAELSGAT